MRSQTPRSRTARAVVAQTAVALALALPATAQMGRQVPPEQAYDAERVGTYVAHLRTLMADRHGDLAEAFFRLSDGLAMTPNGLNARPVAPVVPEHTTAVSAEDLFRYQTSEGGSLGRMHGADAHASGFAWFPHSMYAQGGGRYAVWGFARLLRAVRWYAEGQAAD
jgi:hypothetical protein